MQRPPGAVWSGSGRDVSSGPRANSRTCARSSRDRAGRFASGAPVGKGDLLNFRWDWTVPAAVTLYKPDGSTADVSTAGLSFVVLAAYLDSADAKEGMLTLTIQADLLKVIP